MIPTFSSVPVGNSPDLARVLGLPRRPPPDLEGLEGAALAEMARRRLVRKRTTPCACASMKRACATSPRPVQGWFLHELEICRGAHGIIGVGHGKMFLNFMSAWYLPGAKTVALLMPPGQKVQLVREYLWWKEHFLVPSLVVDERWLAGEPGSPAVHVIPFSRLSRPESTALLTRLAPDAFVIDEAHRLRYPQTAGTGRFIRYIAESERDIPVAAYSGTLPGTKLSDSAHLAAITLGEGSPMPIDPTTTQEWGTCIDPSPCRAPAGALKKLCEPGEDARSGFRRRLKETRGVIATTESAVDASLNFRVRPTKTPASVREALRGLRGSWERPDGELFSEILEMKTCARQLGYGFYYKWVFPRGESKELIDRWKAARKEWHKELREKLKNAREHLDSPMLCAMAARRAWGTCKNEKTVECACVRDEENSCPPECAGCGGCDRVPGPGCRECAGTGAVVVPADLPLWKADSWPAWAAIKDQVQPQTEAVWVDDWLARDAAEWARKHRGVVWYEHDAFGRRVVELAGLPLHGGGPGAEVRILAEKGDRCVVASIRAHGEGRDGLQRLFRHQLIANMPTSGKVMEQLLGRLHRIGQEADEVDSDVYRHEVEIREALESAVEQARFVQETTGSRQKLLAATMEF